MRLTLPPVYAITDRAVSGEPDVAAIAGRLLAVGIRCIQVRDKTLPDRELLRAVEAAAALARPLRARIFVNDRADVAKIAGVGVHLGEEDLPPAAARALLGPDSPIGVSTHTFAAAGREFAGADADYVAFGPIFESATKSVRAPRGLEELARVAARKTKPLVAIGGITADRLDSVWDAGADAAAMIGGLLSGGRIEERARQALDAARRRRTRRRLYIVGFMAAGKTSVGRRVAERLALPFIDLDTEIERASGRTIRALFEESGEAAFRAREAAFLAGTDSIPAAVIATGGGSFAQEDIRRRMTGLGVSIFLDVPLAAVRARLKDKTDRPLFQSPEQLEGLFADRAAFYRMADVRVGLSGDESVEEASDRVLTALEEREDIPA